MQRPASAVSPATPSSDENPCAPEHSVGHLHSMQSLSSGKKQTAYESLTFFLKTNEVLQAVAFSDERSEFDAIPAALLNRVLTPFEAAGHMHSWSLLGGFGRVKSYAMTAWTNQRVIWVTQYDGQTTLHSAPLVPPAFGSTFKCGMPGGS